MPYYLEMMLLLTDITWLKYVGKTNFLVLKLSRSVQTLMLFKEKGKIKMQCLQMINFLADS